MGYPRTVRALASIAYEDAQRSLAAGDRLKAARHAYTFDVLSNVIAALPNRADTRLTATPLPVQFLQERLRIDEVVVEDLTSDLEKICQQRITQRVTDRRPILPRRDDVLGPEERELLRDERLLETKSPLDFPDR